MRSTSTAEPRPGRRWHPRLLAISDRRAVAGGEAGFLRWLAALVEIGVDAVQLREKDLSDRALHHLAAAARATLPAPCRLLINGRPDVALAVGADGVHLPADGLPTGAVRRSFPRLLVGRSTHRVEEVCRARDEGAHYVTFGPVWPTPSKAAFGPAVGPGELRRAVAAGLPVLALGGVDGERLAEAAAAGAAGAAAIRIFLEPTAVGTAVAAAGRLFPASATFRAKLKDSGGERTPR